MQQFLKMTDQVNKKHNTIEIQKSPGNLFQSELENFEAYQSLMHKLRPNILELEMYCDLIKKCYTFGEIMMKCLDNETEDNKVVSGPLKPTPLRLTDIFSERMIWKIEHINIVLGSIIQMMIGNICTMTGVERQLIEEDISGELKGLAKIFLWLVLQDQKRYEMLYPTGKEIKVNDYVKAMSYIDTQPAEWKYCTNIVRCTITKEVEEYLSSRITLGIQPEISPESILSKTSSIVTPSLAKVYAESLNKILNFLKEANVKIRTHILDPESLPPSHAALYNFRNIEPRIPGPGFHYSERDSDSWISSDATETPVRSFGRIEKENKASLWDFMETLVSRILRKAKVYQADVNFEAIVMSLFEMTWLEVEDVEFIPTPKPFNKLDKAIFHELCNKWGSVALVLDSIVLLEPAIGKFIASSVKQHLLTPPRKRNKICRFFSSVGHCLLNVVDAAFPGAISNEPESEPLSPIQPFEIPTDEEKKEVIREFMDTLITRILRKAKVHKADVNFEAIVMDLSEITWLKVKDIQFSAAPEEFDKLDKAIFLELCDQWSSVALVLHYINLLDPVIGNFIASSVKLHLLTPPWKRNTICRFFSSVGHCFEKVCCLQ